MIIGTVLLKELVYLLFRDAFSGFDAENVANLTEKQITTISMQYAFDISTVRGVVDNAKRIIEVRGGYDNIFCLLYLMSG